MGAGSASSLHGPARRDESLGGDLSAEDPLAILVGLLSAEEVQLEGFEIEGGEELFECAVHAPRRVGNPGSAVLS